MKVSITQLCPSLCDPVDCSPPGSSSMEFSRQEYWSGLPWPSPGYLPDPGIEPGSPALQAGSLPSEPPGNGHEFEEIRGDGKDREAWGAAVHGVTKSPTWLSETEQQQHEVEHTYPLRSSNAMPGPRAFCSCGPRINMRKWLVQPRTQSHKRWCHGVHCASLGVLPVLSHKIL